MTRQLDAWKGAFGDAYTDRNRVDWHLRHRAWQDMTRGLVLRTVLEVGCNTGVNLTALAHINPHWRLVGVEPNSHAREEALAAGHLAVNGTASRIPFRDRNFDLVFTAGVLIHVPPEDLNDALAELYRVTDHYLLCIEYHADQETAINYRNQPDMLWKRNYLQEYLRRFGDLALVRTGYWAPKDGFDRCIWSLMERP